MEDEGKSESIQHKPSVLLQRAVLFFLLCAFPENVPHFFLFQNISFLAHRSLEHLCRPLGGYLSLLSTLCQQVPWNLALGEGLETAGLTGACECQGLSSATPPLPQLVSRDASLAVGHLGMWKHCHTIWLFSRPPFGSIILGG